MKIFKTDNLFDDDDVEETENREFEIIIQYFSSVYITLLSQLLIKSIISKIERISISSPLQAKETRLDQPEKTRDPSFFFFFYLTKSIRRNCNFKFRKIQNCTKLVINLRHDVTHISSHRANP